MASHVVAATTLTDGDYVKIDWALTSEQGEPLPAAVDLFDQGVCNLVVGNGYVEGLHEALKSKAWSEEKETIVVENFFGERNPDLVASVPLKNAPPGLKAGDMVRANIGNCVVTEVTDSAVVIDANKPLAGETARLDVAVLDKLDNTTLRHITFGGGCFWGIELAFQRQLGVVATKVGYANGQTPNPTYEQVCTGTTGHTEAVQVTYDPALVDLAALCDLFWDRLGENRFALNQVGNDRGTQYRHGIYVHSADDFPVAQHSFDKEQAKHPGRPIVTELQDLAVFHDAEWYHQQYLQSGGQSAKKSASETIRCYG